MTETIFRVVGQLHHPHLYEPQAPKGVNDPSKKKYNCLVVVDEVQTPLKALQDSITSLLFEKFGNPLPPGINMCLARGKAALPKEPGLADKWILKCKAESDSPPELVYNDTNHNKIVNRADLYSGAIVMVYIRLYSYDKVAKGINAGLDGVMKLADGERLDNKPDVQTMFGGVAPNPNMHASGDVPTTAPQEAPGQAPAAAYDWD